MNLQNGYRKLYAERIDGETSFYASKANSCNPTEDTKLGSFTDTEYEGRLIYAKGGSIYAATKNVPNFEEDERLDNFDKVFIKNDQI